MLPEHVNIVLLSATIPNYKELADWVGRIRQKKVYVEITYFRPVPLNHYILVGKKMMLIKEHEKPLDREYVRKLFSEALVKKDKARANKKGKHLKEKKTDKVKQNEEKSGEGTEKDTNAESKDNEDSDDEDDEDDESEEEQKTVGGGDPNQPVDVEAIKDQAEQPEKTKLTANQKQYQKKARKQANKAALHHQTAGGAKANKSNNDLRQNLSLVIEKELYPCVVFVFSKKQCNELCMSSTSLDALNSREKSKVKRFFKKAISILDPEDRELQQIKELEFCLEMGVGYHHAGLLPILKEIVEILFADGLIKILFATTTFAMGLNMPARSVMFIKLQKFNGKEEVFLEASEYLQMAGRAGRRGKDDVGYSLLYFEKAQMYRQQGVADEIAQMMNVKSGSLESKYKLTYRIILHVLGKGESGFEEIQRIMKSSFLENENFKAKVSEGQRIKALEEKLDACQDIECFKGVPDSISIYNSTLNELFSLNYQFAASASPKVLNFPTVIEFTMDGQNYHIGTAIHNDKNTKTLTVLSPDVVKFNPIEYEDEKLEGQDTMNLEIGYKNVTRSFDKSLRTEANFMTATQLKYSSKQDILEELEAIDRDTLKEPRPKKGKKGKKATGGASGGSKRHDLIRTLKESPCNQCPEFAKHLRQINSQATTHKEMGKLMHNMKDDVLIKSEEFTNKMKVLKDLGFIDKNEVLTVKGKFSQHISSADLVILTLFVFEGGFIDLPDDEMIASLAMTMTKAGGGSQDDIHPDYLPPSFFDNKVVLEGIAQNVIELEDKFGVKDEQKEASKRLNFVFPLVAFEWAKKTKFRDICEMSFQEAGTMITALRSLVKLCEELSMAYKEIDNEGISERFAKLSEEMRRDILFLPSLYYEKDMRVKEGE